MDHKTLNSFFEIKNFRKKNLESLNIKSLIKPPDPLIERQIIPLNKPKFGKNYEIINLESFNVNNNNNEIENFFLNKREKCYYYEKEQLIDIYINSYKMLQKLIYYKDKFDNDKVTCDNIINLFELENKKNKNKNKKNEYITSEELIKRNNFNEEETLIFESKFESGNLQLVYLIEKNPDENIYIDKYELFLTNDSNTTGYNQWFFFRIKNIKRNKKVNLTIMNLLRKKSKYENGIKIWYYSKKENLYENKSWHHSKENVKYYRNHLYKNINSKKKYYYSLSFDFTFKYDNDEIFFANCIPFTYTDLMKDLNYYQKYENSKFPFFQRKTLCQTLLGNDLDYITINSSNKNIINYNIENKKKEGIILFARQHPSETVSSYVIKGTIEFLMSESEEAKFLRDNFIFKIIPMINVDGVILGNSRTSIAGCDLNRRWKNPNEYFHPEIYYCKDLIKNLSLNNKINCIIDYHGHFGAFNSFFYCNHRKENFSSGKFFPFISSKKSKIISFEKSHFSMPRYKKGTGRISLFQELDIDNIVTLETSYFGCNIKDYSNQYFTIDLLKEIGKDICIGLLYLYYYNNLLFGIENLNFNNYQSLKNKIENDFFQFKNEYDKLILKKEKKYKEIIKENINETLSEISIHENNENEKNEDEDPYKDESMSESEPSGDNLNIEEIEKLIPVNRKNKKQLKKKKINIFKKKQLNDFIKKNIFENINNQNLNLLTSYNNKLNILTKINNDINDKNNNNVKTEFIKEQNESNIINNTYNNNFLKSVPNINYNQTLTLPKLTNLNLKKQIKLKPSLKTEMLDNSIKNLENIKEENITSTRKYYNYDNTQLSTSKTNENNIKDVKQKINEETQTEEIFFKMPWTYFAGSFKIITSKIKHSNLNKTMVPNFFFQKYGNTKKKLSFRNKFYNNNRNYNQTNIFMEDDIKNLINVFTFQNKNNTFRNQNNLNYNSLTEKNNKSKSLENNNLKCIDLKKNNLNS